MTTEEMARLISARVIVRGDTGREIRGGFQGDIMSRAMAKGFSGMAWITHRADMNALAVAVMKGAACVIFPEEIEPEADVIHRAETEGMPLMSTEQSAFELAGRLYEAGLRGEGEIEDRAQL